MDAFEIFLHNAMVIIYITAISVYLDELIHILRKPKYKYSLFTQKEETKYMILTLASIIMLIFEFIINLDIILFTLDFLALLIIAHIMGKH